MKWFIINFILQLLPCSRLYGFKCFLLKWGGAKIGKNVRVMRIIVNGVNLSIGNNTFIGNYTMITGASGSNVVIGSNIAISDRVNILTGSHKIGTIEQVAGEGTGEDVVISDGAWIGLGATILPGVTIGKGAVVASCSCVNRDVASGTMVAGVPAMVKKKIF